MIPADIELDVDPVTDMEPYQLPCFLYFSNSVRRFHLMLGSTCVHLPIDDFDETFFSRFGQPIWVSSFYRFESMKKT